MLPGLVSGYDSDSSSSSESGADAHPSTTAGGAGPSTSTPSNALSNSSSLASKLGLPLPSSSSPSLTSAKPLRGLTASLPPPKSSSSSSSSSSTSTSAAPVKRKNQIRIESLGDLAVDEEHRREMTSADGTTSSTKKPRLEALQSRSIASSHGLFGMLPAPSRKGPPTPPGKSDREDVANGNIEAVGEARMTLHETQGHGTSSGKGTAKGNSDFRAMLGLKPIPSTVKAAPGEEVSSGETPPSYKTPTLSDVRSSKAIPPASAPVNPTATTSHSSAPSTSTQAKKPAPLSPPLDFFSLSSPTSSDRPSSNQPTSAAPSRKAISSAPSIEETPSYTGWHQNPDGSWIPVTPEAIAAYEAHRASLLAAGHLQTDPDTHTDADTDREDRELKKLRDQGIDLDSLASVDLEATRIQWEQRPMEARAGPDSALLDAKYAAAAGLPTELDGEGDDEDDDGARRKVKNNGDLAGVKDVRGKGSKGRGQLSSLIAQAAERKDELQQKWAQGKSNRAAAGNRYGW